MNIKSGKEKLQIVGSLAQRMVKAEGIDMEVHYSDAPIPHHIDRLPESAHGLVQQFSHMSG